MDTEADEYVCFGITGSFIWNILEKPSTLEEISSEVAAAFEISLDTAQGDCQEFIQSLLARNYIAQTQA